MMDKPVSVTLRNPWTWPNTELAVEYSLGGEVLQADLARSGRDWSASIPSGSEYRSIVVTGGAVSYAGSIVEVDDGN